MVLMKFHISLKTKRNYRSLTHPLLSYKCQVPSPCPNKPPSHSNLTQNKGTWTQGRQYNHTGWSYVLDLYFITIVSRAHNLCKSGLDPTDCKSRHSNNISMVSITTCSLLGYLFECGVAMPLPAQMVSGLSLPSADRHWGYL